MNKTTRKNKILVVLNGNNLPAMPVVKQALAM